jgi:hypothetical protein
MSTITVKDSLKASTINTANNLYNNNYKDLKAYKLTYLKVKELGI